MKLIIKKIIVVVISFFIISWLQSKDDKRNNKIRKTYYEKFKFPLLVSSMIGFLLTMNEFFSNNITEVTIVTPVESCIDVETVQEIKPPKNFSRNSPSDFNQEIDLNLPDF